MAKEANSVEISRDFDAPRETVFKMFTDSRKATKWWGPEGYDKLVFELDPNPGGAIRIDDRSPEGVINRTSGTIVDIIAPELLVFRTSTIGGDGAAPWEALQSVTFEELGPKRTRVTVIVSVSAFGSWEGDVDSLKQGFKGGWTESFDMLERELR